MGDVPYKIFVSEILIMGWAVIDLTRLVHEKVKSEQSARKTVLISFMHLGQNHPPKEIIDEQCRQ